MNDWISDVWIALSARGRLGSQCENCEGTVQADYVGKLSGVTLCDLHVQMELFFLRMEDVYGGKND